MTSGACGKYSIYPVREIYTMKINQILIFITTAIVLYSISSSGPVNTSFVTNKSCKTNLDCHRSEFCNNFKCISACAVENCPEDRLCQVQSHRASCQCPTNYLMNKVSHKCEKKITSDKSCFNNYTCNSWEICINRICIDACAIRKCDEHQGCVSKHHESSCYCLTGSSMNSTSNKCQEDKCASDAACPGRQICNKNADGIRDCECMPGHKESPEGYCGKNCTMRSECGINEMCKSNNCTCDTLSIFRTYEWDDGIKECMNI